MSKIHRQFAGVLAAAANAVVDFARSVPARTLYVGCEPGCHESDDRLDFATIVSPRTADGTVLVIQPARDLQDHLVSVALKATFFEAVLDDPDREVPDVRVPLVAYVSDEFHRFVTSDPVHGEQSYLDTSRSYGGVCVLATQSTANIQHALAHGAGHSGATDAALAILWTNTATKFVFRTTDTDTVNRLASLCPQYPGVEPLVRVRPPATLEVGACFASLPDGRFERCYLEPWAAPEPEPNPRLVPPIATPQPGVAVEACAASAEGGSSDR